MKGYLYLSNAVAVMMMGGNVLAQCVSTQDCATLGYTDSSCSGDNGGVKCPFGDKWACYPEPDNSIFCKVGTLYYSDNTCSADYDSSKTLLGIVIYEKSASESGWVMTHKPVATGIAWGGFGTDISGLTNTTTSSKLTDIQASCTNTDIITAYGSSSTYPAAWAAKNYNGGGKTWCLPSGGLLKNALNNSANFTKFNDAISKIQASAGTSAATILGNVSSNREYVLSSSEYGSGNAWYFLVHTGDSFGIDYNSKDGNPSSYSVRPVFAFQFFYPSPNDSVVDLSP